MTKKNLLTSWPGCRTSPATSNSCVPRAVCRMHLDAVLASGRGGWGWEAIVVAMAGLVETLSSRYVAAGVAVLDT